MDQQADQQLITKFINFSRERDWTLFQMGLSVGLTKQWASLLTHGKITRLQFRTRNRLKQLLGEK